MFYTTFLLFFLTKHIYSITHAYQLFTQNIYTLLYYKGSHTKYNKQVTFLGKRATRLIKMFISFYTL